MTEKLNQTIKEEISKLPQEMQEAINAFDWVKVTVDIGKEHNLTEDELTNFQLETLLGLTGVTDLDFYAVNIENEVELSESDSQAIANEALKKIFSPLRKTIEEKIKNNLKNKTPDWKQSIDFVLSGGDYDAFMGGYYSKEEEKEQKNPKIGDLKSKLVI